MNFIALSIVGVFTLFTNLSYSFDQRAEDLSFDDKLDQHLRQVKARQAKTPNIDLEADLSGMWVYSDIRSDRKGADIYSHAVMVEKTNFAVNYQGSEDQPFYRVEGNIFKKSAYQPFGFYIATADDGTRVIRWIGLRDGHQNGIQVFEAMTKIRRHEMDSGYKFKTDGKKFEIEEGQRILKIEGSVLHLSIRDRRNETSPTHQITFERLPILKATN